MSAADAITLETERLTIRPFALDDLDAIHAILNEAFGEVPRAERQEWLEWLVRNYTALARLYQPPYGDRAVVLQATGAVIGAVGLVPSFGPFERLPALRAHSSEPSTGLFSPEVGLFWVVAAAYRGHGYATEAARALVEFAFAHLNLKRIVAMTEEDNTASIAVMQRLGMTVQRPSDPAPEWFQVVGILDNPAGRAEA
jgi:RimJ/RimL family protein N-acetyltransferase